MTRHQFGNISEIPGRQKNGQIRHSLINPHNWSRVCYWISRQPSCCVPPHLGGRGSCRAVELAFFHHGMPRKYTEKWHRGWCCIACGTNVACPGFCHGTFVKNDGCTLGRARLLPSRRACFFSPRNATEVHGKMAPWLVLHRAWKQMWLVPFSAIERS